MDVGYAACMHQRQAHTHRPPVGWLHSVVWPATGAVLGAMLRWLTLDALPAGPASLLAINTLACFLMGGLRPGQWLGVGVLGGYSSFSSTCLQVALLPLLPGISYAGATLAACLVSWRLGDLWACRRSQGTVNGNERARCREALLHIPEASGEMPGLGTPDEQRPEATR